MGRSASKKLVVACLSISGLIAVGRGQSGRNTPKPETPAAVSEAATGYSESRPSGRHRSGMPPAAEEQEVWADKNTGARNSGSDVSSDEIIKVETDLITVPVSVFDKSGLYVRDLKRSDFRVFEDGVEQEISYFGTSEKPLTVVLLLDTSLSTNYKIEEIRQAAVAFVDQLRAQDAVAVIEFDGNVNVLSNPTNDRSRTYRAIGKADFGYGTSLYDAVFFTLQKKLSKIEGRKAIVLFTDGVDTTSEKAGYETTLSFAEESDTTVFPIYYDTFSWTQRPGGSSLSLMSTVGTSAEDYARGRRYLVELADSTGGRVFVPSAAPGGLSSAFEGIAEELRRQYYIGYIPAQAGVPGQRKQIRVRVNRPHLLIQARDGYVVGRSKRSTGGKRGG